MADVKKARVVKTMAIQEDVCYLSCEMVVPMELGFKGGQYIIVNSGKLLANGKLGKRAYSILSADTRQDSFELAVKRIPDGIGSGFMHDLKVGDSFEFSGPWGKYHGGNMATEERLLCIATDTGITAALGLLRGQGAKPFSAGSTLLWSFPREDYFIPSGMVRAWLPEFLSAQFLREDPLAEFEGLVRDRLFTKIYLSGDGHIIVKLKERFLSLGYTPEQIFSESFFNHESFKTTRF